MAVVLIVGQPWVAIVGCGLVGAGLAMIVPILYGAAEPRAGHHAGGGDCCSLVHRLCRFHGRSTADWCDRAARIARPPPWLVVVAATILALSARYVPEKAA